jgi:hypothetical protein
MQGLIAISISLCTLFNPGTSNKEYLEQKQCVVYYNNCITTKLNQYHIFRDESTVNAVVTQCIIEYKQ